MTIGKSKLESLIYHGIKRGREGEKGDLPREKKEWIESDTWAALYVETARSIKVLIDRFTTFNGVCRTVGIYSRRGIARVK